jgi:hypothetical protein
MLYQARFKPTLAVMGMVVLVALVGAAPAAAAPDNTGWIPLTLLEVSSTVARGGQARLVAVVFPDRARCTIAVDSKNGATQPQGVDPKWPAPGGRLAWTWKVGARAALGRWLIRVDCGRLGSLRTHFRIVP